ncbi:unnamed protein product [Mytilus coruscus]|uniref:C-type lectin domain-containing protein n=1 Tax=Mytilus coruscus TaxID=42192 RepID=A0A6J8A448_MYTCO|nr:unnamed protein product [Mytilus coruscus]
MFPRISMLCMLHILKRSSASGIGIDEETFTSEKGKILIQNPYTTQLQQERSLFRCARMCMAMTKCCVSSYNVSSNICALDTSGCCYSKTMTYVESVLIRKVSVEYKQETTSVYRVYQVCSYCFISGVLCVVEGYKWKATSVYQVCSSCCISGVLCVVEGYKWKATSAYQVCSSFCISGVLCVVEEGYKWKATSVYQVCSSFCISGVLCVVEGYKWKARSVYQNISLYVIILYFVYCRQRAGHLAEINDNEENNFMKTVISAGGATGRALFIGATKSSAVWIWDDSRSSVIYFDWESSQPNGGEHCIALLQNAWHDYGCYEEHGFICESQVY